MTKHLMPCGLLAVALIGLGFSGAASAGKGGNNDCPVGVLPGSPGDPDTTLDLEFGTGTQALTRCLERRHKVKVVVQINQFCRDAVPNASCTRPYALGNIRNMISDYEDTHGMEQGKDYEIVAIVHSGGGWQMLTNEGYNGSGVWVTGRNQFEATVRGLMDDGVKFYFCQNTTRGFIGNNTLPTVDETPGGATAELIEGVEYTTAGVTAIADLQSKGYTYVQP
jgi:intracellular sulfur oxidation DsrE/DsrF family protein